MSHSPYHFAGNNPISNREINGMEYLIGPDGNGGWLWGSGINDSGGIDASVGGGYSGGRGPTSFFGPGGNVGNTGSNQFGVGGTRGPTYEEIQRMREEEKKKKAIEALLSGQCSYFFRDSDNDGEIDEFQLYLTESEEWFVFGSDENDPDGDPNQQPPDWNSLSKEARAAVILNAWYENSKNGMLILDVESLFENFPDAVIGGTMIAEINLQRLEFFFGKRNHIHFELHIGSGVEYENIIEFGIVETRLGGHRDADGIPEKRIWDFNNTQDSRIVTMSFPRQYETWFGIWLGLYRK